MPTRAAAAGRLPVFATVVETVIVAPGAALAGPTTAVRARSGLPTTSGDAAARALLSSSASATAPSRSATAPSQRVPAAFAGSVTAVVSVLAAPGARAGTLR